MKNNKNTAYNILLRLLRGKFMTLNNNFLKIKRIKINVLESHLNMVLKGENKSKNRSKDLIKSRN